MPHVLIIILCYNGVDDTVACLRSLQQVIYASFDILVVDNASSDHTPDRVRAEFPEVAVIETGANLGFAAGNNVGLRYALANGYEYALLLNNDTEVEPSFLQKLIDVAESDSRIGVVGPTIYYYERPDLIWSAGGMIDWQHGQTSMREIQPLAPGDVDFVTGCALLVKHETIKQAGMLDERFFMYYEETEWCVRIARTGFRIVHVPEAQLWHKIPLNARADREYLAYYMTRNRLLFLQATKAPLSTWVDALILQDLRTYLSLLFRPRWQKRSGRIGMWKAWRDFWSGRFGIMPQS